MQMPSISSSKFALKLMRLVMCWYFIADAIAQESLKPCPEEFPVEAIRLAPPDGWKGIVPSVVRLTSVDVILGPPTQPGAVQIGKRRKMRDGHQIVFDSLYTTTGHPEEKWLACRYRDLALAQRLPDDTESCIVSYYRRPAYNDYDIQVACRLARPANAK